MTNVPLSSRLLITVRSDSVQISRRAVLALLGATGASIVTAPITGARSRNISKGLGQAKPGQALVQTAEAAGIVVLEQAKQALAEGSFAVGGAMIENRSGRIIHQWHNTVYQLLPNGQSALVSKRFVLDPTNHGERQLVSWYYENAAALNLPEPSELTIVTSLDPCAQCAGSLLAAGFNVGVVAFDDPTGINYTLDGSYPDLPLNLRKQAQRTFTYYAVQGVRPRVGPANGPAFATMILSKATADGCSDVFLKSRGVVEEERRVLGLPPSELRDPATLPADSRLRQALVKASPLAFSLRLADFRKPNAALKDTLSRLVASTPRATNAVAYIDPYGNLISAFADRFDVSPIATALMNLVQSYFRTRFALMGDPKTNELAKNYLTTPKYGTLVFLRALAPDAATSVKDIGIYDLSIEGEAYQPQTGNWQYYLEPPTGTEAEFLALIKQMKSADGADPKRIVL